ncbi:MAG: hypothetical protein QOD06_2158 [Candidatus Binatota bacterium]|nr:hypothetical protein [Candidatus Binatota bacterium]
MGNKSRPSVNKRRKEAARREKKQAKLERMATRARDKQVKPAGEGEDPDIAGIVPGPQPLPEEMRDLAAEDEER